MAAYTEKMYDHALYRFTSFVSKHGDKATEKMVTRISRMTNLKKLSATEQVARDVGEIKIARCAHRRMYQLI